MNKEFALIWFAIAVLFALIAFHVWDESIRFQRIEQRQ